MPEKAWVILEDDCSWEYDGNSSVEICTKVPVAVAFTYEDAQEYTAHFNGYESPYEIIEVKKI